ncbi:MAG: hypothetical protein M3Q31_06260 [Actinomycetota bacterium]|nr:hypothetical protein [Actinomycetota bacterium]
MPRVVTISLKRWPLARAKTRAAIRAQLVSAREQRYRLEYHDPSGSIRLHFSPRRDRRAAKDEIDAVLDAADRRWRRAFDLYPNESSLRRRGAQGRSGRPPRSSATARSNGLVTNALSVTSVWSSMEPALGACVRSEAGALLGMRL